MNKVVADALTLVYKFLMPLCSKFNPALIERGLLSIAGEDAFDFSSQLMPLGSYEKVQSTLARLNERESIRKNKGVYYTPTDVVDFIVANTIKASLGVLTPENIHSLDLASEFDEDFCLKKTVFEPTCGAGEFLLATLIWKHCLNTMQERFLNAHSLKIATESRSIQGNYFCRGMYMLQSLPKGVFISCRSAFQTSLF